MNDILKFNKCYVWFHLGHYPKMYMRIHIIISNILDTSYFDAEDLKLIEGGSDTNKGNIQCG